MSQVDSIMQKVTADLHELNERREVEWLAETKPEPADAAGLYEMRQIGTRRFKYRWSYESNSHGAFWMRWRESRSRSKFLTTLVAKRKAKEER